MMILLHLLVFLGTLEIFAIEVNGQRRRANGDQSVQLKNIHSEDFNPDLFQDYSFGQREVLQNANRRRRQHETKDLLLLDINFPSSVPKEPRKGNDPSPSRRRKNQSRGIAQNRAGVKILDTSTNKANIRVGRPNESERINSGSNNFRQTTPTPSENKRNPTSTIRNNQASPNNTIARKPKRVSSTTPRGNISPDRNSKNIQGSRRVISSQNKSNPPQQANNIRKLRLGNNGQNSRKAENQVRVPSSNSRPTGNPSQNSQTAAVRTKKRTRKRISARHNENLPQESRQIEITQNSPRFVESMKKFEAARIAQTYRSEVIPITRSTTSKPRPPYIGQSGTNLKSPWELNRGNGRFSIPILPGLVDPEKNSVRRIESGDGQSYLRRVRSHIISPYIQIVQLGNVSLDTRRIESANNKPDFRRIEASEDLTGEIIEIPKNSTDTAPGTKTEMPQDVSEPSSETKKETSPGEVDIPPSETKMEMSPGEVDVPPSETIIEMSPGEVDEPPSETKKETSPGEVDIHPSETKMEMSPREVDVPPSETKMEMFPGEVDEPPSETKMEISPGEVDEPPSETKMEMSPEEVDVPPSETKMEMSPGEVVEPPSETKMEMSPGGADELPSENETEPGVGYAAPWINMEMPPLGDPNDNIIVDPYEREEGKSIIYPVEWSVLGYPLDRKGSARQDSNIENVRIVKRCRLGYFLSLHTNTCIGKIGRSIPSVILERLQRKKL